MVGLKNRQQPWTRNIPLGPSSLSMGNGPRGTAPGPFPLIVILRGGAVPPNSGAVPPPLYITIRGNGPGAVPPGPFPMDKLDGPSGKDNTGNDNDKSFSWSRVDAYFSIQNSQI